VARGLDRQRIFRDDRDRDDFVRRLAGLAKEGVFMVYAWALLPNHLHLLVRTGSRPLARAMRSLLTGYAGTFNRRHRRTGHLFQNRYRSTVVDEESYFLELIRYLHLNPLRAGVVGDLKALERYPFCGHGVLATGQPSPWQETGSVLRLFGGRVSQARRSYKSFVAEGVAHGRRPELMGGGLIRSAGGWAAVRDLRRGREAFSADERILGRSEFVEQMLRDVEREEAKRERIARQAPPLTMLADRVTRAAKVTVEALLGGGRRREVARAREGLAYLWVEVLGRSGRALSRQLHVRPESVLREARRGREERLRWDRLLG
jgi:REP element-mobilizing transposase RayT